MTRIGYLCKAIPLDDLLRLAEGAGFHVEDNIIYCTDGFMRVTENVERFANLVANYLQVRYEKNVNAFSSSP